jgi:AcrR family transcriptional regulator
MQYTAAGTMTSDTENKILDAALKLFAEKGYVGATTRLIAQEAGVSELTLFRRFKTKDNLFNKVLDQNHEKMRQEFNAILLDNDYKDSREFLETFIKNYSNVLDNNFDTFCLTINEGNRINNSLSLQLFNQFTEYLSDKIPNDKVDPGTFVMTITGFIYMLHLEKKSEVINYNESLERFINNSVECIQNSNG